MIVTCINPNGYNLTLNSQYTVLTERGDFYTINNDKGITVIYSKKLFTTITTTNNDIPTPVEKKQLSDTDILNSLNITEYDEDSFIINVDTDDGKYTIAYTLDINQTSISCGIIEIYGLQAQLEEIRDVLINKSDTLYISILNKILEATIDCFIEGVFVILSSNTNYKYFDILNKAIYKLNVVSEVEGINPNSENNIVLWTIEIENEIDDEIED